MGWSTLSSIGKIWALLGVCGDNSVLLFKIQNRSPGFFSSHFRVLQNKKGQLASWVSWAASSSTWTASMLLTPGYDGVMLLLLLGSYGGVQWKQMSELWPT